MQVQGTGTQAVNARRCFIKPAVQRKVAKFIREFLLARDYSWHHVYNRPGATQWNYKVCNVRLTQEDKQMLIQKLAVEFSCIKPFILIDYTVGGGYNGNYFGGLTVRIFASDDARKAFMRNNHIASYIGDPLVQTPKAAPVVEQPVVQEEPVAGPFETEDAEVQAHIMGDITSNELLLIQMFRDANADVKAIKEMALKAVDLNDNNASTKIMKALCKQHEAITSQWPEDTQWDF